MGDNASLLLSDYLEKHYRPLRQKIAQLLGNDDLAGDALQDTWLRIRSRDHEQDGPIRSPMGYLVRMAVNLAIDFRRRQSRIIPYDAVEALLDIAAESPGPAEVAEDRSNLEEIERILERMPRRRREVLLMVRVEGLEQKEAAWRLGVSLRTVEYELKRAHDYLDSRMSGRREK